MDDAASGYMTGQLLIAMPQMRDPRFQRSVIYMCVHNEQCAMGLVVNRLVNSLTFPDLLQQLNIDAENLKQTIRVHFGGPVEAGRGFVLHSDDFRDTGTTIVPGGLALTATIDILKAIATGGGPANAILALGYAGWAPGQLEYEMHQGSWGVLSSNAIDIFSKDPRTLWPDSIGLLQAPRTISNER